MKAIKCDLCGSFYNPEVYPERCPYCLEEQEARKKTIMAIKTIDPFREKAQKNCERTDNRHVVRCLVCEFWIDDRSEFCPYCGAPVAKSQGKKAVKDVLDQLPNREKQISARLCMNCMELVPDSIQHCPHCGNLSSSNNQNSILLLNKGTMIANRYMIGTAIERTEANVVYISWDSEMRRKVSVIEYFPTNYATRMKNQNELLIAADERRKERFSTGKKQFINTAKSLIQLKQDGIEKVYDCFEENGTAYVITEYADGIPLKNLLDRYGPFTEKQTTELISSIAKTLDELNKSGVFHGNISPEQIYICSNKDGTRTVLKGFYDLRIRWPGEIEPPIEPYYSFFWPEERWNYKTPAGAVTDVYELAAVIYYMVTGDCYSVSGIKRRFEIETKRKDRLNTVAKRTFGLSDCFISALLNALSIKASDRTQSVEEFLKEATQKEEVIRHDTTWKTMNRLERKRWKERKL